MGMPTYLHSTMQVQAVAVVARLHLPWNIEDGTWRQQQHGSSREAGTSQVSEARRATAALADGGVPPRRTKQTAPPLRSPPLQVAWQAGNKKGRSGLMHEVEACLPACRDWPA